MAAGCRTPSAAGTERPATGFGAIYEVLATEVGVLVGRPAGWRAWPGPGRRPGASARSGPSPATGNRCPIGERIAYAYPSRSLMAPGAVQVTGAT
ncbi:hypothetical protein ABT373_11015 [Streptomyces sp. NPDC000070]|uniref:hypothetical protein n=1 Tax=Streptomyces sp. NPDC000070 TaxID=3154240 RepID=UPI00333153E9